MESLNPEEAPKQPDLQTLNHLIVVLDQPGTRSSNHYPLLKYLGNPAHFTPSELYTFDRSEKVINFKYGVGTEDKC